MFAQIILSVMFGCVGALMAFVGVFSLFKTRQFKAGALETSGTVVTNEMTTKWSRLNRRSINVYRPIFEYTDLQGVLRRAKGSESYPPSFAEGAKVQVLYSRDDPDHAEINAFGEQWLTSVIFSIFGAVFLCVPIYIWVYDIPVSLSGMGFTVPGVARESQSGSYSQAPGTQVLPQAAGKPDPIAITSAEPKLAVVGQPITIRGSNFGDKEDHAAWMGGHGISVDLRVIDWKNDTVVVQIPDDPKIQRNLSYWYRIGRIKKYAGSTTHLGGSNLFMFEFDKKAGIQPGAATLQKPGGAGEPKESLDTQQVAGPDYYKCRSDNKQAYLLFEITENLIAFREGVGRIPSLPNDPRNSARFDDVQYEGPIAMTISAYRRMGGTAKGLNKVTPVPNPCAHLEPSKLHPRGLRGRNQNSSMTVQNPVFSTAAKER